MVAESVGAKRVPCNLYPTQKAQARVILAGEEGLVGNEKQIAWDG